MLEDIGRDFKIIVIKMGNVLRRIFKVGISEERVKIFMADIKRLQVFSKVRDTDHRALPRHTLSENFSSACPLPTCQTPILYFCGMHMYQCEVFYPSC